MSLELFTNLASTTVTAGCNTAPAPGTVETWTVASSASFPAVTTAAGTVFRIEEDDPTRQTEVILVTNVSGTSWTVTRGAEGTTPVAHPLGSSFVQTISAATLTGFADVDGPNTFTGDQTISKNIPKLLLTDGTRPGVVGIATAAGDVAAGSAVGDLVVGCGTVGAYAGRVFLPGSLGIVGAINSLSPLNGSDVQVSGSSVSRGRVASIAPITGNQTGITGIVDVTGGSFTYTLVAGRRYKFHAQGLGCLSTVATDVYQVGLVLGGVQYQLYRGPCGATTQANTSFSVEVPVKCVASGAVAPDEINAGSTVCKLTVQRSTGTGTLQLTAAATAPITFFVEDIGT